MPIKNYSTEIDEARTVGEIVGLLSSKGARSVRIDYDDQNRPNGIGFIVEYNKVPIPFKLPCNFQGVYNALLRDYRTNQAKRAFERNPESMARSRRIAWRIVKDWVAAQMAIIEAEQASLIQVFLPYVAQRDGKTVFDQFIEHIDKTKCLPEAASETV